MTTHRCSRCGGFTDCPMRNIGTGRQKPLTGYTGNHSSVHAVLSRVPATWLLPASIRADLNASQVRRKGMRQYWYDADVQTLLSDLVGWGYAEMQKMPHSKKYQYRWKARRIAA